MSGLFAVVAQGVVSNIVAAAEGWSTPDGEVVAVPPSVPVSIGWSWDGQQFASPEAVVSWDDVRERRDGLLVLSDWTQVADAPVDQQAWAVYRQTLRDIPQDFDSPDDVVWPVAP